MVGTNPENTPCMQSTGRTTLDDLYDKIRQYWLARPFDSEDAIDAALQNFRILFAYHSAKIENDAVEYQDTREIFENGLVTSFAGDPRTLFEQQNQKLCYEYLKPLLVAHTPLSLDLTREIHRILTAGTYDARRYVARNERPGEFKKGDYVTGIHEVGYPPDEVEPALRELIREFDAWQGDDPLVPAAYLHVRFEHIHPFADGNGRTGRTLMNYWLMCHNHPPVVIHEDVRKTYYAALEQYDADETLQPMIDFLREQTVRTWSGALRRSHGDASGLRRKNLRAYTSPH